MTVRNALFVSALALIAVIGHTATANAAVMDMGCWNCRYTTEYMWPLILVHAECISAPDGGGGLGINCKTAYTNSFFGINTVEDCEFDGGECMYIEVHGRLKQEQKVRMRLAAGKATASTHQKIYCF
jgi:hypothetical protein